MEVPSAPFPEQPTPDPPGVPDPSPAEQPSPVEPDVPAEPDPGPAAA